MERNTKSKLNTQIYEEACEWFIEFRGGDLDAPARREFDLWVRKSPEHLAAYLEIAAIWNEGPALDPKEKWDASTLIAQAAPDPDNVISIASHSSSSPSPASGGGLGWGRAAIAASIIALVLITAVWFQFFRMPSYVTAVGEQRSLTLADGSTVELNSRSKIEVRYSAQERSIELMEGQALFHVAKDPARPFVVRSDAARVRAVGTAFDVYKKSAGTVITVVEGRVAISSPPPLAGEGRVGAFPTFLSAGEQLTVTPQSAKKAKHPNVATATAWTQRQLVFESASLSEVAEEFNRYNERQLVIEEPALYDFHISGVFSSADPASLIRFLHERPGVKVTETATEIRVAKNIL